MKKKMNMNMQKNQIIQVDIHWIKLNYELIK